MYKIVASVPKYSPFFICPEIFSVFIVLGIYNFTDYIAKHRIDEAIDVVKE